MTKRTGFIVGMIVIALLVFTIPSFAQAGDRDGDGVPDRVDNCPAVPGPRENNGCPLPDTGGSNPPDGRNDRDGDGVADFVDACPDQPGTGFTNGCPVDETQPETPNTQPQPFVQPAVMVWQDTTTCMVGVPPANGFSINVRAAATTSAPILGQLAPGQQFAPLFVDYDENGEVWYGGAPVGDLWGWVAGFVMTDNGQCDNLPAVIAVDAPYLPQVGLALDPDSLIESTSQLLIGGAIGSFATEGNEDAPAPGGGTMSVDDWDTHEIQILFDLTGNPELPPELLGVKFHDYLISSYQTGGSNDATNNNEPAPQYQNTFFAIPASLDGASLQPLVLFKVNDADVSDESCASTGEGFCVLSVLLLPAFGDEPGQCSPDVFSEAMLATFHGYLKIDDVDGESMNSAAGDGDTDGRDFLIWQRNLGSDAAGNTPKLGEYAINGNSLGLLLPAVQVARQAAANEVQLKNASNFVSNTGDEGSAPELTLLGDGSVIPVETMPLNYANAGRDRSCAMVAGVPSAGNYDWFLLLPALPGA